jgi:hypothetical protein
VCYHADEIPVCACREKHIVDLRTFTELVGLQPAGCFPIRSCRCGDVHPFVGIVIRDSAEDRLIPLGGIAGEVVGVGYGWSSNIILQHLSENQIRSQIHWVWAEVYFLNSAYGTVYPSHIHAFSIDLSINSCWGCFYRDGIRCTIENVNFRWGTPLELHVLPN